jgi:hypothetical protein
MPVSGFLGRVTKYSQGLQLNPAENRLTEVTAGVLEHVRGFAKELVEGMLVFAIEDLNMRAEAAAHEVDELREHTAKFDRRLQELRASRGRRAEIRTQFGTSTGGFVDLEIRLRPDTLRHDHDLICSVQ